MSTTLESSYLLMSINSLLQRLESPKKGKVVWYYLHKHIFSLLQTNVVISLLPKRTLHKNALTSSTLPSREAYVGNFIIFTYLYCFPEILANNCRYYSIKYWLKQYYFRSFILRALRLYHLPIWKSYPMPIFFFWQVFQQDRGYCILVLFVRRNPFFWIR